MRPFSANAPRRLFVYAESKDDLNHRLAKGERVIAVDYGLDVIALGAETRLDEDLQKGTIIIICEREHHNFERPLAKDYGIWGGRKVI